MKIDIFCHIIPEKYDRALSRAGLPVPRVRERHQVFPPVLFDLDLRFKCMDNFEGLAQVLTLAESPVDHLADTKTAAGLARIVNDEMAELVVRYPDRFVAGVATLPLNDMDAALKEADRALTDLNLRGVQISTSISDRSLDSPEFLPLYEKMSRYDLPIWIHPARGPERADYRNEDRSIYNIFFVYDWPHETNLAMVRLACSGVLAKYPNLKFITHHCGGTIPCLAARITDLGTKGRMTEGPKYAPLAGEPVDYLRMFYGDTATYGQVSNLMCGYEFFGADHILFGTDMPFSVGEPGVSGVRQVISGIDSMPINDLDKKKIYEGNAKRLMRLPS